MSKVEISKKTAVAPSNRAPIAVANPPKTTGDLKLQHAPGCTCNECVVFANNVASGVNPADMIAQKLAAARARQQAQPTRVEPPPSNTTALSPGPITAPNSVPGSATGRVMTPTNTTPQPERQQRNPAHSSSIRHEPGRAPTPSGENNNTWNAPSVQRTSLSEKTTQQVSLGHTSLTVSPPRERQITPTSTLPEQLSSTMWGNPNTREAPLSSDLGFVPRESVTTIKQELTPQFFTNETTSTSLPAERAFVTPANDIWGSNFGNLHVGTEPHRNSSPMTEIQLERPATTVESNHPRSSWTYLAENSTRGSESAAWDVSPSKQREDRGSAYRDHTPNTIPAQESPKNRDIRTNSAVTGLSYKENQAPTRVRHIRDNREIPSVSPSSRPKAPLNSDISSIRERHSAVVTTKHPHLRKMHIDRPQTSRIERQAHTSTLRSAPRATPQKVQALQPTGVAGTQIRKGTTRPNGEHVHRIKLNQKREIVATEAIPSRKLLNNIFPTVEIKKREKKKQLPPAADRPFIMPEHSISISSQTEEHEDDSMNTLLSVRGRRSVKQRIDKIRTRSRTLRAGIRKITQTQRAVKKIAQSALGTIGTFYKSWRKHYELN